MTIHLVEHLSPEPALFGAMAAVLAAARGLAVAHLPAAFDLSRYPDARQHVTADGHLVTSGLLWAERLAGHAVGAETDLDALSRRADDVVVPFAADGEAASAGAALAARGAAVVRWRVAEAGGRFRLLDAAGREPDPALGAWTRDRHGRLVPADAPGPAASASPISVVLVGSRDDQWSAYPANLAALGDAADALGLSLEVTLLPPKGLDDAAAVAAVAGAGGVVLPGGADMGNVPGQIRVAEAALAAGTPLLGLCLGMQTLATALVRTRPEGRGASLAEADPDAPVKTFTPLVPDAALHRCGDRTLSAAAGSRLAAAAGQRSTVRCNHRFRLAPSLVPVAEAAGLVVVAAGREPGVDGPVIDVVERAGTPFCVGFQGHPELSSRSGAPHPIFVAFLRAVAEAGPRTA